MKVKRTKRCCYCGETKPVKEFDLCEGRRDGLQTNCRECRRTSRAMALGESQGRYRKTEKGQRAVKRYQRSEKGQQALKRASLHYRQSERGRQRSREAAKRWGVENRDRMRAYNKVRNAVAGGHLERPKVCGSCGEPGKLICYWENYEQPLEVEWLHRECIETRLAKDSRS